MGLFRGKQAGDKARATPGPSPVSPEDDTVLQTLLQELDRYTPGSSKARREQARFPFSHQTLRVTLFQPGGSATTCNVATRNLSRTGAGLLHRAYVHPRSRCVLELPALDGGTAPVHGTIVRCTHVHGLVHELGIVFDQPLDLHRFLGPDTILGPFILEQMDPSVLEGSVLFVLPEEFDRRMAQLYTAGTGLHVQTVASLDEWRRLDSGAPDVVVLDVTTPGLGADPAATAMLLGESLLVALGEAEALAQFRTLQVRDDALALRRPLLQTNLLAAIVESLSVTRAGGGEAHHPGDQTSPIATRAVEELRRAAVELRGAIDGKDATRCHSICQHIRILGEHAGSGRVQRAAEAAKVKLAATMSAEESGAELEELLRACGRREAA